MESISIHVERSGEWMPAEELREAALAALCEEHDIVLDLSGIDHLDASALQVLLALHRVQAERGRTLELHHASASLHEWFSYAGAAAQLLPAPSATR